MSMKVCGEEPSWVRQIVGIVESNGYGGLEPHRVALNFIRLALQRLTCKYNTAQIPVGEG